MSDPDDFLRQFRAAPREEFAHGLHAHLKRMQPQPHPPQFLQQLVLGLGGACVALAFALAVLVGVQAARQPVALYPVASGGQLQTARVALLLETRSAAVRPALYQPASNLVLQPPLKVGCPLAHHHP